MSIFDDDLAIKEVSGSPVAKLWIENKIDEVIRDCKIDIRNRSDLYDMITGSWLHFMPSFKDYYYDEHLTRNGVYRTNTHVVQTKQHEYRITVVLLDKDYQELEKIDLYKTI